MKHIISFSGGKDSTAMLLMMIEKGMRIDEIIFCDTEKEFPQMYDHIKKVERYIGKKITILKNEYTFDYMFLEYIPKRKDATIRKGKSWMSFNLRWCTGYFKRDLFRKHLKHIGEYITYIGFAADEVKRIKKKNSHKINQKYPLIEWGVTEKQALEYCYSKGFDWDGLYKTFHRVSCYLCPFQRLSELETVYWNFPELWEDMRRLDKNTYRRFRTDYSLKELEEKFNAKKLKSSSKAKAGKKK